MGNKLTIVIWDVQHGSGAYIRTPNGKHIVQDLGTGSHTGPSTFSPLYRLGHNYGVQRIDELIITHPHRDHMNDIVNIDMLTPAVFTRPRHLTKDEVWAGNENADKDIVRKYLEMDEKYGYPVPQSDDPKSPANNGGALISSFVPRTCPRTNLNNHSLVTVVLYETVKVILPGDNEPPSWLELLDGSDFRDAIKDAQVLLAPHHGRDSGFCSDLFKYVQPWLTIVSDGRFCDNSATPRYSRVTTGWVVHRRKGDDEERKCLTTRSDGVIVIEIGRGDNGRPFLSVTVD